MISGIKLSIKSVQMKICYKIKEFSNLDNKIFKSTIKIYLMITIFSMYCLVSTVRRI